MPIYRITYSERFRRVALYNHGCNFKCAWCSYKLKPRKPGGFLSMERIKAVLRRLDPERVHFLGGEPTLWPGLAEIAEFAHEAGAYTRIGHSTGFNMPPEHIDAVSVSIKTLSDRLHRKYTGVSNERVLRNFEAMWERGISLDASSVLIPGLVDREDIERIARFIADINREIPYHITGYVPVPAAPWRAPTPEEVKEAEKAASHYLRHVTSSCLSVEDFLHLRERDERYRSVSVG